MHPEAERRVRHLDALVRAVTLRETNDLPCLPVDGIERAARGDPADFGGRIKARTSSADRRGPYGEAVRLRHDVRWVADTAAVCGQRCEMLPRRASSCVAWAAR
jgi:hypothetical protein